MGVFTFWAYGDMRKDMRRIGRPLAELLPPEAAPTLDLLAQQQLLR